MSSNQLTPRILELAGTITASVAKIQQVLTEKGLPSPSFDEDAMQSLPLEASDAQDAVLDATAELYDLLMEPMGLIHGHGGHNNSLCQQVITRFGIAAMIPPGGRVSFADIAKQTPLTEQMIGRILRHAMTMRIFYEPEAGMVAHTKASRILIDPVHNNWLGAGTEEMWLASAKVVDALQKWPGSQEPNETGFCVANETTESIYTFLGSHPERATRFGNAMIAYGMKPEHDPAYITDYFDWASLGQAQVVHICGGTGYFAMALAKRHSNLRVVVQDVAMMMGPAEAGVPEEVKGRVTFEPHDFFAPQTIKGDVFYFRWVLRNWADKYCILALKAQIPMLKHGARVIIQDIIMPEPGAAPLWKEKSARSNDLSLVATFNSRDRTVADWKSLLEEADKGFILKNVTKPKGSALGILEFAWEGKV
ncbi:S-adenosyl-L-methionine-dependent methyltransferase [Tricladium varicosporioides]|nr:S-adenosyl-L-methionine-dependent methyltransferase [Hymenoscyphus varicosporioides]